jgi:hypothetical protein
VCIVIKKRGDEMCFTKVKFKTALIVVSVKTAIYVRKRLIDYKRIFPPKLEDYVSF